MRQYIEGDIEIDGRNIPYPCFTTRDYLEQKENMTEEEIEKFQEEDDCKRFDLITEIMALKQSCYLMRRVSHSCGTLSESLYDLKNRLIRELSEVHKFEFDDDFVENFMND